MEKIKTIITIWLSKVIGTFLKISHKGNGTALPGLIAERISPNIIRHLSPQIKTKILITGTNGKTTTQTVLASIMKSAGKRIISNKSGSNLKRGLISNLVSDSNIFGKINAEVMIFEIEEATMPKVIEDIKPDIIIVTNFFRDQLDAYGEIDRTQKFIKESIEKSPNAKIILNADDPRVSVLTKDLENETHYFGLEDHSEFNYEGDNSNKKYKDILKAQNIQIRNDLTTSFDFNNKNYSTQISGKFHVYNIIAAITAARLLDIKPEIIKIGVEKTRPAFGRGEVIHIDEIIYKLLLVKNPAGMNLTLKLLKNSINPSIIFILNDRIADGRDVSWIWDSYFELLNEINPKRIIVSGTRAEELLLRIKYALGGLEKKAHYKYLSPQGIEIKFMKKIEAVHEYLYKEKTLKSGTKHYKNKPFYYVLPTYTAMLAFRKDLLGNALDE